MSRFFEERELEKEFMNASRLKRKWIIIRETVHMLFLLLQGISPIVLYLVGGIYLFMVAVSYARAGNLIYPTLIMVLLGAFVMRIFDREGEE